MLATHRPDTPHLSNINRFRDPDGTTREWEASASAQLRLGNPTALPAYTDRDRIRGGDRQPMLDAAYTAWRTDTDNGLDSMLLAHDNDTVTALNLRAQAERTAAGHVKPPRSPARLRHHRRRGGPDHHPPQRPHPTNPTRDRERGGRSPSPPDRFVRNGQQFSVTATHPDASLTAVDRHGHTSLRDIASTSNSATPSPCPPTTSPSISNSATPPPSTAPKVPPSTPATSSPPPA